MKARGLVFLCTLISLALACDGKPQAEKAEKAEPAPAAETPTETKEPATAPEAPTPTPTPTPAAPESGGGEVPDAAPIDPASIRTPTGAAEALRQWVLAHPNGGKPPSELFRAKSAITLAISIDGCDGDEADCVTRLDLADAAAFETWLSENVGELPGMEVSSKIVSCNDAHCCTYANLGQEASAEDGMVPHELFELRAVCFDVDADDQHVLGVRRLKLVNW